MDASLIVASVLIGAASYRGWRIMGKDQITEPFRALLIARESRVSMFILDLIGCAWCLGFWLSGAAALLFSAGWSAQEYAIVWLAASAVAGLLGELDGLLTRESETLSQ